MTANQPETSSTAEVPERKGRIPADTFAVRLLLSRHLAGMGLKEAAEACGLHYATWSTWEAGRRPRDLIDVCERVAQGLDVDFDWLLLGGPLAGPRGRVVTKRPGKFSADYRPQPVRPGADRPKVRTDSHRPIFGPQIGRRAVRLIQDPTYEAL
jgi:transcriptional regulator with XRE-family HTH domain